MSALLELRDGEARYGPVQALRGVSICLKNNQIGGAVRASDFGAKSVDLSFNPCNDRY